MKRWLPLIISVIAHGLLIGWIATQQLELPSTDGPTQNPPLRAVLLLPTPPPAEPIVVSKPETENEPESESEIEVTPEPERETELEPELVSEPKQQPAEDTPPQGSDPAVEEDIATLFDGRKSHSDIVNATREALSNLEKMGIENGAKDASRYYAEKDDRIISEGPKLDFEDIRRNQKEVGFVNVDCKTATTELLTNLSSIFGGRFKCRSYSNKDINQYIQRHLNKNIDPPEEDGQNR